MPSSSITFINVYNRHITADSRSLQPELVFPIQQTPCITAGDFNIHSKNSDPRRKLNRREERLAAKYFDTALLLDYTLLNIPGIATRFSPNLSQRHSVIDLAFANTSALQLFESWTNNLPHTGSDHTAIRIRLSTDNYTPNIQQLTPDWNKANWPAIHTQLKTTQLPEPTPDTEEWFENALGTITSSILEHVPDKRPSRWSKPWWSPHLTTLRRIYHSVARDFKKGFAPPFALKAAKNNYFDSIQKAKDRHWNDYVAQADSTQIWSLKRSATRDKITKLPSFPDATNPIDTNKAMIAHFFPPLPSPIPRIPPLHFANVPEISALEVSQALAASSNNSAPGPDSFPPLVWKQVHFANPQLLPRLLTPLLQTGYHPRKLKTAFGVVLAKPKKPDYSSPAAYRIIVLLETISKVLERIMCYRLADHARESNLIHPHQCGSIRGLSTADAFTTLQHEVRLLQRAKLKVSTLFLDVKGGFDHVNPMKLAEILHKHDTPLYLIHWVLSFLTERKCTLLFPGSPRLPLPVDVGVPQGSPISPLLFCIYVSPLHIDPDPGITISYVDDFAFTVASPSYTQNIRLLEEAYTKATNTGSPMNIFFSLPKTDLMHWRTPKDKSPIDTTPIVLENTTIKPGNEIRWLGFQCTPSLDPHPHFKKRVTAAMASFAIIRQFSSAGKGLTASNCRKLAMMAILPILTYGASCLQPLNKSIKLLENAWHSVLRWVTNCFRSTPIAILQAESSCPPIDLYISSLRLRYAARILSAPPEYNPVAARLPDNFPSTSPFRRNQNRKLLRGIPNPPILWNSARRGVARLPIDQLCHSLLTNSPDFAQNQGVIPNLGLLIKRNTTHIWQSLPTPDYYPWPISPKPHPHLLLNRFISGRICQMRAHKSYLAAHPSWMHPDASPICPRCEEEEETMQHAILDCPAREHIRTLFIPHITTLEDCFKSIEALRALSDYIARSRTGFPVENQASKSPLYSLSSSSSLTSLSSLELEAGQ